MSDAAKQGGKTVTIYSDGGADPNPGIGGWAAILRMDGRERVLKGHDPQTTNNRMELTAAIEALRALPPGRQITFYTDSQYVRRGITEWIDNWAEAGWQRRGGKPIANVDLWQQLWPLTRQHEIDWRWVKGHSGDPLNERVDELARQARLEITADETMAQDMPRLYVRASCRGNPGPGGWGVVVERGDETTQLSGSEPSTTNNRMEIRAALEALEQISTGGEAQLITTSDYLYQGATRWIHGWRQRNWQKKGGKAVANADLWQALDRQMQRVNVHWTSAKGDQFGDSAGLEEAGRLAREALDII
ncbi:MAG: ribonuclease HI [Candidatus Promineifilaceae bacterium]|nr:ribonuclease HI [Candidatus Promineifilaceae bacterium]